MAVCLHGEVILAEGTLTDAYVLCEAGRIVSIGSQAHEGLAVLEGRYIAPGYIDLHVHGGDGADYMDGSADAVRTANRAHAQRGTTTIFPTTTTGSTEELAAMIAACGEVREGWTVADGARIEGIHYYGPYFAEDKVGCHSVAGRRDPRREEYERKR